MVNSKLCFYTDHGELYVSRELESDLYGITEGVTSIERACNTGMWTCADGADKKIDKDDLDHIKKKAEYFYG